MWLLLSNRLVYFSYSIVSGRLRRMLWPVTLPGLRTDVTNALHFKLAHEVGVYNFVQRLLYIGVLSAGVLVVLSGLAIWKPVQLS